MEDREIIELFFLRPERAIAELTDKYGTEMRRVAFYVLRDEQDVDLITMRSAFFRRRRCTSRCQGNVMS